MLRLLSPEDARLPRADSTLPLRTGSSRPEPRPDPEPASWPPGRCTSCRRPETGAAAGECEGSADTVAAVTVRAPEIKNLLLPTALPPRTHCTFNNRSMTKSASSTLSQCPTHATITAARQPPPPPPPPPHPPRPSLLGAALLASVFSRPSSARRFGSPWGGGGGGVLRRDVLGDSRWNATLPVANQ